MNAIKNAYVTFTRTVVVENVEGLSDSEIRDKAVYVHNEADMDDIYANKDSVVEIDIQEEDIENDN
jgi:hypothetical protein